MLEAGGRADVRVYKFEEEELVTCSKKENLDIRLAEVKRSRKCSSETHSNLGAEAAIRMHCFSIIRLGALWLQG